MKKLFLPYINNFLFKPLSSNVFGFFRISVALVALLICVLLIPDFYLLFGKNGLIIWDVTDTLANPLQPTIGRLYHLIGFSIDSDTFLYLFLNVYIVSLLLFLIGWKARITAVLCWFLHLTLLNTCRFGSYGVESMLNIALFYGMFFPVGETFTYKNFRSNPLPNAYSRLCLRVLQIQICIIYASSGIEKAFSTEWWDGNAIWFSLTEEQFCQFDFTALAQFPFIPKMMGWWTLFVEIGYCFGIWFPKTRLFWLLNTILLHIGIGLFMGLYTFAAMMIVLNLSAFGYEYFKRFDWDSAHFLKV
jgi:hypothetical protein